MTTPHTTPRHGVDYIMDTFPIVKRKVERDYGQYRTKLRILEICDQMTHCLATNTEYLSILNSIPDPPRDSVCLSFRFCKLLTQPNIPLKCEQSH